MMGAEPVLVVAAPNGPGASSISVAPVPPLVLSALAGPVFPRRRGAR